MGFGGGCSLPGPKWTVGSPFFYAKLRGWSKVYLPVRGSNLFGERGFWVLLRSYSVVSLGFAASFI